MRMNQNRENLTRASSSSRCSIDRGRDSERGSEGSRERSRERSRDDDRRNINRAVVSNKSTSSTSSLASSQRLSDRTIKMNRRTAHCYALAQTAHLQSKRNCWDVYEPPPPLSLASLPGPTQY